MQFLHQGRVLDDLHSTQRHLERTRGGSAALAGEERRSPRSAALAGALLASNDFTV